MSGKRLGVVVAATALALLGMAPAPATASSETCPSGVICLYYNSVEYGWGSFAYFGQPVTFDLRNYVFGNYGDGSGYDQGVAKNTAAVTNHSSYTWQICQLPDLQGICELIFPGQSDDLISEIKNNDESLGLSFTF
jgi:Peptidase inhibitor family I36